MGFSTILMAIFISLVGIYSLLLLSLNKSVVHLDLLFLEVDLQLGVLVLTFTLLGTLIAIFLEIVFFSLKRKNKDE